MGKINITLQWCHNECDGVPNHWRFNCLLNCTNQRKLQNSASLTFVMGIFQWPLNALHKGLVTQKMFPFDDVIKKPQQNTTKGRVYFSWDTMICHDDVIKWKYFPHYWPFVRGIHRPLLNSPHKGQWCGALMFSLICARINGKQRVNNCQAGDFRSHRAPYDVNVMCYHIQNYVSRVHLTSVCENLTMAKGVQRCVFIHSIDFKLINWY